MSTHNLDIILEALLFVKNEPLSFKKLADVLGTGETDVKHAAATLKVKLAERGIRLMEKDGAIMLATAPEASALIEAIQREELSRDLGKAGLETVSIIVYKGSVTKTEIDFIRGVNSQFILRNLLIRGLVERVPNPEGRAALYRPTFDLLRFLGVASITELPNYETVRKELTRYQSPASDGDARGKAEESIE